MPTWFRYFVNAWRFFASNFNILSHLTNIIFFTCINSFEYYTSRVGDLFHFLVIDFILISYKSLVSSWNFFIKHLKDGWFFSQYEISIKIIWFFNLKKSGGKIIFLITFFTQFVTELLIYDTIDKLVWVICIQEFWSDLTPPINDCVRKNLDASNWFEKATFILKQCYIRILIF